MKKMGKSYYDIIRFPVRPYMLLRMYYNTSSRRRWTGGRARVEIERERVKKLLHTPSVPLPAPDRPLAANNIILYTNARVQLANTCDIIISVPSDSDFKFTIEGARYGTAGRKDGRTIRTTTMCCDYTAAMTLNKALWFLFFFSSLFFRFRDILYV